MCPGEYTEIEIMGHTCCQEKSHNTDTGPTSHSTDLNGQVYGSIATRVPLAKQNKFCGSGEIPGSQSSGQEVCWSQTLFVG